TINVIVEENPVVNREIFEFTAGSTTLDVGTTNLADLPLPDKIIVTLDDNSTVELAVKWENNSTPNYDKDLEGVYVFKGDFILIDGVSNTSGLKAKHTIILEEEDTEGPVDPTENKEITNVPEFGSAFEIGTKPLA